MKHKRSIIGIGITFVSLAFLVAMSSSFRDTRIKAQKQYQSFEANATVIKQSIQDFALFLVNEFHLKGRQGLYEQTVSSNNYYNDLLKRSSEVVSVAGDSALLPQNQKRQLLQSVSQIQNALQALSQAIASIAISQNHIEISATPSLIYLKEAVEHLGSISFIPPKKTSSSTLTSISSKFCLHGCDSV